MNIGLYGFGVIGARFAEMLHVFRPVLRVYDPYVQELPDYITPVDSLEELFAQSEAISIHAGVSEETRKSVKIYRRSNSFCPKYLKKGRFGLKTLPGIPEKSYLLRIWDRFFKKSIKVFFDGKEYSN